MRFQKLLSLFLSLSLAGGAALNFSGCSEQGPMQPDNAQSEITLAKGKPGGDKGEYKYPLSTDVTFLWVNKKQGFQGGQLKLENGATFSFGSGDLTPPEGWTDDRIILTMSADLDSATNELVFTFGPSGCKFNPPAEVWLNYADLGIANPKLFYLDKNGNRIEQTPDHVDTRGNKLLLYIDHFSRYAIGGI